MEKKLIVTVSRSFNLTAETVFEAWIKPKWIGQWMFGPEVRDEEIIKLETYPKEGGAFTFAVRRNGEEINHLGTYLEFEPPHRLFFTWGIESESEDESEVRIEITQNETGCRLSLTHELDSKWKEYAGRTEDAWSMMLDKLNEVLG